MRPIPDSADLEDPQWQAALFDLALQLVKDGCRAKTVKRFTGVSHTRVTQMFRSVHGEDAPGGPCSQGSPQFFVSGNQSRRFSGLSWNVQGAIFLSCYLQLSHAVAIPANRGWLLLHAHRAYLRLTKAIEATGAVRRLDINQALAMLAFCGLNTIPELADIATQRCPECYTPYLIDTGKEPEAQECPVCAIRRNGERLARQAAQLRNQSSTQPGDPAVEGDLSAEGDTRAA